MPLRSAGTLRSVLLATSIALLASPLAAQTTRDLSDMYNLALERDPVLQAARNRLRASQELTPQARALFLPEVNLDAEANRNWETIDGTPAFGDLAAPGTSDSQSLTYNAWSAGISLTQPLFRMESFALRDQAAIVLDQSSLQFAEVQQDLLLRVSEAYFDVLLAQDQVGTLEAEQRAIDTELRRARRALDVGTGTVTDVNEAQARFDLVEARILRARNTLTIARENLRRLIGEQPGTLAGLRDDFSAEPPAPTDPAAWADRAERYNISVRLAQRDFDRAREEIRVQRAGHYPRVDFVARHGRNYQSDSQQFDGSFDTEVSSIGIRLQMPLFAGGATSSQVRQAEAERDAFFDDTVDARRQAALQAESTYLNLASNQREISALEQALRSIRSTEESTRRGVEVGLRTTLDLLNVQRDRFETERELAQARYEYLLNYLRLQVAVGSGIDGSSIDDVNFFLTRDAD
ncbi:outer membrane protein [Natronocella acetinitrilica]|uniref:Outer membrane protein n=1 Tax=Natronocella acetinitrilica TaxID=414046 RepID=A0AAE3G241_9GAMM|nr:TolC family outer membrane protein [Natronocella acetinitrilica]MCP1673748.1 outer membrane protein [Natronocella acetinitrilica]